MSQIKFAEKAQRMFKIVEQCQNSGLPKKDFCHQHNIPRSQYYYWQKKYREHFRDEESGFVAVDTDTAVGTKDDIKINLPNGVSIQLPLHTPPTTIKQLLTLT